MKNNLQFRSATKADLVAIMAIINQAKLNFRNNNIDQWQNNYPNEEDILNDISRNNSYVVVSGDEVVGTTALIFDHNDAYLNIYDGKWSNDHKYSIINRIAVDNNYKGGRVATLMIKEVEAISRKNNVFNLRVTTHQDNLAMHNFLLKNGFNMAGIIYLDGVFKRQAYEKSLD